MQGYREESGLFTRFFQMAYPALQTKSQLATEESEGCIFFLAN